MGHEDFSVRPGTVPERECREGSLIVAWRHPLSPALLPGTVCLMAGVSLSINRGGP